MIAWLIAFVTAPIALWLVFSGAPSAFVAVSVVVLAVALLVGAATDSTPWWAIMLLGILLLTMSFALTEVRAVTASLAGVAAVGIGFAKRLRGAR